jgi:hypothetical protein
MSLIELCSYSPNVDYSSHEEVVMSDVYSKGREASPEVKEKLESFGIKDFKSFQLNNLVLVHHQQGPSLFQVVEK